MSLRPSGTAAALVSALALALSTAACDSPSSGSGGAASAPHAESDAASAPSAKAEPTTPVAPLAPEWRGAVGDGAAVARLVVSGNRVTGGYFFEKDGAAHKLDGSGSGSHVVLDETVDGAKAATLTLDVAADGSVSGTRSAKDGDKPVRLTPLSPASPVVSALVFKRTLHATRERPDAKGPGGGCRTDLEYAEVYGLAPSVAAKINADLAPSSDVAPPATCREDMVTTAGYRVAHDADGFLSVRITTETKGPGDERKRSGRALTVRLDTGVPLKLFGDVVKPKAERVFETATSAEVAGLARKFKLDAQGRSALDQGFAFSPPFVLEDRGVHLFADALPKDYAAAGEEGVVVRYATLPRPAGPAGVMWGK